MSKSTYYEIEELVTRARKLGIACTSKPWKSDTNDMLYTTHYCPETDMMWTHNYPDKHRICKQHNLNSPDEYLRLLAGAMSDPVL